MHFDFTLEVYTKLLLALRNSRYSVVTFKDYLAQPYPQSCVILRHDVDARPAYALRMARLEQNLEFQATYCFRATPGIFDIQIMRQISYLDHEIAYHYEDLALQKGDYEKAIESFGINLNKFRSVYPVSTISMHGSPLSKWDNRLLWQRYDYREYGILGEPYLDLDFDDWLYVTDTGRSWNNSNASVRDKVDTSYNFAFSSTFQLISAIEGNDLPDRVMINIHPQRWHDNGILWVTELLSQSVKNCIKRAVVQSKSASNRASYSSS